MMSTRPAGLMIGAILLAVAVTFVNTVGNGLVWDDVGLILQNPDNTRPIDVRRVFSTPHAIWPEDKLPYYRPLNQLIYLCEYRLWGERPAPYHAASLGLHLVNVALVFLLGVRLWGGAGWAPAALASWFGLHPVVAETVNFVSALNDLLATGFFLAALLAYLRSVESFHRGWLSLSAMLFLGGVLSKETALMLLPLLLVAGAGTLPGAPVFSRRVVWLLPHVAVAATFLAVRAAVLGDPVGAPVLTGDLAGRVAAVHYVIAHYTLTMLWPFALNAIYSWPVWAAQGTTWSWLVFLATSLLLAAAWRAGGVLRLGVLWVLLNLIPVSGVVPIPSAPVADRYAYLPSVGAWVLIVGGLSTRLTRPRSLAVSLPVLVGLAVLSAHRNAVWHDEVSLFSSVVAADPDSVQGHYNLGNALRDAGRLDEAAGHWRDAVRLNPTHAHALNQLGNVLFIRRQWPEAIEYYRRSLAVDAGNWAAHYNLARLLELAGKNEEALRHYRRFLVLRPESEAHLDAAVAARIQALTSPP